jgi:hypothetical protein
MMTKVNPQQERERLTALYAGMSDLELLEIAKDPETLTEWASSTLGNELERRGLQVPPVPEKREPDQPIVLRRYRDLPAAVIERSVLENSGIECTLLDDNLVRMDWFWSNALGGIKLVVREKDAEEANRILNESTPIDPANEESGKS